MKKPSTLILLTAALVALAACGAKKDEGELTAQDSQELNNASEMLDTSPDSLVASDNVALGNGEDAADASVGTNPGVGTEANSANDFGEVARGNSE